MSTPLRPAFCGDMRHHDTHTWLWVDEWRICYAGPTKEDVSYGGFQPTHRVLRNYNPYDRGDLLRLVEGREGGIHEVMFLFEDAGGSSAWMPLNVMEAIDG